MDQSIKTVLKSVLTNQSKNEITAYHFDGKEVSQLENPIIMRNTILLELYSPDQFLILHAEKDSEIEPDEFKSGLECILAVGIDHNGKKYRILGASSSLKDGRLWLSSEEVRNDIKARFSNSNEALTYLGIFSTNCTYGIFDMAEEIEIVDDGYAVSDSAAM